MDKVFNIVVADDDIDDQDLIQHAFNDAKVKIMLTKVFNGLELMDYLLQREKYRKSAPTPPDVIFLDLNMPLMDGLTALKLIKESDQLKNIPVYIITTSKSEREKAEALSLGVAGFYHKGATSQDIRNIVKSICVECFA